MMLSDWPDDDLDALLQELEGDTLAGLAAKAGMRTTGMLALVDEQCARALDGERLLISTPPQEGKSTRCSVLFPVWAMMQKPGLRVAVASYSLDLAMDFSRKARELCKRLYGPIIMAGDNRAAQWRMDNGSTYTSVGVGSSFTGRAVDLLIIDDPVKSADEARSKRARDRVWDWWQSVALTRMAPDAGALVIMTRWHKSDLNGRLRASGWPSVNVPAQAERDDDPLGRKPGEWLESVRDRTPTQWTRIKKGLSDYFWRALYQGSPVASVGKIIDTAKLGRVENDFIRQQGDQCWVRVPMTICQSWDLAFSAGEHNDYVAGQVWGQLGDSYYLLDSVHGHYSFTDTVDQVLRLAARWPQTSRVLVEKAANGAALIDTLKKKLAITPIVPRSSKEVRALAIQPYVDQGKVKLVDGAYNDKFLPELDDFPTGAHDDQVDAMTQGIHSFSNSDYFRLG